MRIVDENYLEYVRKQPCCICNKPPPSQVHYIEAKGVGSGKRIDVATNCVPICWECQGVVQGSFDYQIKCWTWIADKIGLASWEVCREACWRLLRTPKEQRQ